MSDLFEKKLFLSPAARRRGGKAGFALGRILSVIFFVIALGMFFGGLFFWLQKRQASPGFRSGRADLRHAGDVVRRIESRSERQGGL